MKYILFLLFFVKIGWSSAQCDSIQPLNIEIVALAKEKIGKKVLRGQCWDLAKYVLDESGAKWNGLDEYGEKLNKSACLMPGDIIQFNNIKLKYTIGNKSFTELMTLHTAIVYEVVSEDELVLIHQNTAYSGKKVGTSGFRFSSIVKGKYQVYRPQMN